MKNIKLIDLTFVIIVGFVATIISSALIGTLDYVLYTTIGFSLRIVYLGAVYFIANQVRRQYILPAPLYQWITVAFVVSGYLFTDVVLYTFGYSLEALPAITKIIFSFEYLYVHFFYYTGGLESVLTSFINLLFIGISGYIAYQKTN